MSLITTKVSEGGRIIIPAEMRRKFGLSVGDTVNLRDDDGYIEISTPKMALEKLRKRLRDVVPEGVSLVDELITERRREGENE
ncbi:MAG: AbrB/MazE/SpoVT family DNA-binding domain-containing protein [Acidobacteria bacterium]|nr:AbrB/MazE/SpoVT family DNA-binding domain-containing protein [Acidobacteriota bacterium]